jgi:hypothetical protein
MKQIPEMNVEMISKLPAALLQGPRFVNWRWGTTKDGKLAKVPYSAATGTNTNGATLASGIHASVALSNVNAAVGIGIITGNAKGTFAMTVLDIDYKTVKPALLVEFAGALMPSIVKSFITAAVRSGSYVEISPSGLGVRIITPATFSAGEDHPTRWKLTVAQVKAPGMTDEDVSHLVSEIGGEVYSKNRWLTLTGNNAAMDALGFPAAAWDPQSASVAAAGYLSIFYSTFLQEQAEVRAVNAARRASIAANVEPLSDADAVAALEAAMKNASFKAQYNGENVDNDESKADYQLCRLLAAVFAGNTEHMDRAFRASALMRPKWDEARGSMTYGQRTLDFAVSRWDGRPLATDFVRAGEISWSQEQRDVLILKGTESIPHLAQRRATRALLMDLFARVDQGECWVSGGALYVKAGSLTQLAGRIGGDPTILGQRLKTLASAGFLHSYTTDARGCPQIALHLQGSQNPVVAAGKAKG